MIIIVNQDFVLLKSQKVNILISDQSDILRDCVEWEIDFYGRLSFFVVY
jgi:hypothetical protein